MVVSSVEAIAFSVGMQTSVHKRSIIKIGTSATVPNVTTFTI